VLSRSEYLGFEVACAWVPEYCVPELLNERVLELLGTALGLLGCQHLGLPGTMYMELLSNVLGASNAA
jgi:hypothetical protein